MSDRKVLIVDDEPKVCKLFYNYLSQEGFIVITANSAKDALRIISEQSPGIVVLDVKMPDMDGIETLRRIRDISKDIIVIMLTAYKSMYLVVEATRLGAYDYITKPFKLEDLKIIIDRANKHEVLSREVSTLRRELGKKVLYEDIVGNNHRMLEVFKTIGQVADVDTVVLICGESGTGKELVAKAIHYSGKRRDNPFVPVDCASLPPSLLESELFGHEKGAFTGAVSRKLGKFEVAQGGTIFLDEIGNLSLDIQAKLLRVLQEKKVVRVGSTQTIDIDSRIIAATSRDLEQSMAKGDFRADLYYRLNVVPIYIPPLRERKDDIPLLVDTFLKKFSTDSAKPSRTISEKALNLLVRYNWPGNVRELENVIERAVVTGKHEQVWPEDLPERIVGRSFGEKDEIPGVWIHLDIDTMNKNKVSLTHALDRVEEDIITATLKNTRGNLTQAAKVLGTSLRAIRYKVDKYGLRRGKTRKLIG